MSLSSPIGGDAQTRQGAFTTPHWNLEQAPRQQNDFAALNMVRGRQSLRFFLRYLRPLALLVASLSGPDISDAQTNCDACWNTVSNWQGNYNLTVAGTGPFATGTFQLNNSSQGSFTLTNIPGSTVMAGALTGVGNVDVSGSFATTCPEGGSGEFTCSANGSGSLTAGASIFLAIDTTNCTYQITIADALPGTATETECGSQVFQMPFVGAASGDLAAPPGSPLGVLPDFPLPGFGDSLIESGGTFTATTVAAGACGVSGSFTLTVSWNIQPEISSGMPQFTQVPTGGSLGCNPTNIPGASAVLDNTSATAPSGMVSIQAVSVDVTNGCGITRTFTLTATDDCSQQQAHAIVAYSWTNDTTAPMINTVPPGGNLGCNPATPPTDAIVQSQVVALDNCGNPTINVSHTDTTNSCTVTRTFSITASGACGNISSPQTVIYIWTADTNPPTFTQLPPGGDLGTNPPTVPNDAVAQSLSRASDTCSAASITVTHVDTGTSVFTRTFTITAADACNNKTNTTVAYTWTGTIESTTNNPPLLSIARFGTNVVLFWPTDPAGYGLQSETGLITANGWSSVTNIPVIAGGTNFVTNPITRPTLFYRLLLQ